MPRSTRSGKINELQDEKWDSQPETSNDIFKAVVNVNKSVEAKNSKRKKDSKRSTSGSSK